MPRHTLLLAGTIMLLTGCTPRTIDHTHYAFAYVTPANTPRQINDWISLNPDCTAGTAFDVTIIAAPEHGIALIQSGRFYPHYSREDQRYPCNIQPHPGIGLTYTPAPGYVGADLLTISVVNPQGRAWTTDFHLQVR